MPTSFSDLSRDALEAQAERLRFRPVLQFLNLDRVNFKKKGQPYPKGNAAVPDNSVNGLRRRVFDLG